MDFGRLSYRPSLKRVDDERNSISGRKSTAPGFIGTKKFKSSLNHKDLKKYSTHDAQKQVREKVISLLLKLDTIRTEDELDFKVLEKNLNSVLKTVNLLIQCIFPSFEAKSANDVFEVTSKVLLYPYEISNHAFNPCGAPNTWPQIV